MRNNIVLFAYIQLESTYDLTLVVLPLRSFRPTSLTYSVRPEWITLYVYDHQIGTTPQALPNEFEAHHNN